MAINNTTTQNVLVNVNVNNQQASQATQQLHQQIQNLSTVAESLGDVDWGNMTVVQLQQSLTNATNEMNRLKASGVTTGTQVQQLQTNINGVTGALRTMNSLNTFNNLKSGVMTAIGAVQTLQATLNMVGVETEGVEEATERMVALMSFANGIESLLTYGKTLTDIIRTTTLGTRVLQTLKLAISATGIGLLVTGSALLITYWNDIKNIFSSITPSMKSIGITWDSVTASIKGTANVISQFVLTPIRAVVDIFKGDLMGAIDDVKKGLNFKANFDITYNASKLDSEAKTASKKILDAFFSTLNRDYVKDIESQIFKQNEASLKYNKALRDANDKNSAEYKRLDGDIAKAEKEFYENRVKAREKDRDDMGGYIKDWLKQQELINNNLQLTESFYEQLMSTSGDYFLVTSELTKDLNKESTGKLQKFYDDLNKIKKGVSEIDIDLTNLYTTQVAAATDVKNKVIAEREAELQRLKSIADENKRIRDADLKQLNTYINEASKLVETENYDEESKRLDSIREFYEERIALAKKYGKGIKDIEEAFDIEVAQTRLEYDKERKTNLQQYEDAYKRLIKSFTQDTTLDTILVDINLEFAEMVRLTNELDAPADYKETRLSFLEDIRKSAIATTTQIFELERSIKKAEVAIQQSDFEVAIQQARFNLENGEALKKAIEDRTNAELSLESQAFELKKIQYANDNELIEQLELEHQIRLNQIFENGANARREVVKQEIQSRYLMYGSVSDIIGTVSDMLEEGTLAQKSLAIASATINTYSAIAGQLAAFSGIPIPGYAVAQAIATGAVGFAQVAKIAGIGVSKTNNSSTSGSSNTSYQAPIINTTQLVADVGTKDVRPLNQEVDKGPIRAYIVSKDIVEQNNREKVNESLSTY